MISMGSGEAGLYIQTKPDPFLVVVFCLAGLCTYKVWDYQVEKLHILATSKQECRFCTFGSTFQLIYYVDR